MRISFQPVIPILSILMILCLAIPPLQAHSWTSHQGDWLYVGGTGPGNYTTIQGAINEAEDGDFVYVFNSSSPYHENLYVFRSINLIGEDAETTIIHGGNQTHTIEIIANDVRVQGFTMQSSLDGQSGIMLNNAQNVTLKSNIIRENREGITLINSSYNTIQLNSIEDNKDDGITTEAQSCHNLYERNAITNCYSGMVLGGSNEQAFWNKISRCIIGFVLFQSNNSITNNTVIAGGRRIQINGNNNSLIGNSFRATQFGVYIAGTNITFKRNTVTRNIISFQIDFSSDINISKNNIMKNLFDVFFFHCTRLAFDNNFWGRPRLLPKPIIGLKQRFSLFVPHRIIRPEILLDRNPSRAAW